MSKKSLRNLLLSFVLVSVFSLVVALGVRAATEGTVTATVTAQHVSITISDGTVAFGTVSSGSYGDTTDDGVDNTQTATNNGSVSEDFTIKADDTTNWTLESSAGTNQYTLDHCISNCDDSPSWNAISTDYGTLASGIAASNSQDFDLRVGTPTSTTYGEQTITVTVLAAAS